jgi:acyl-CoA dehydrogenase
MFRLNDEQQAYVQWVRTTAEEKIAPLATGTEGRINRPLVAALGRTGLLRGLFGGSADESPRDAAAMQLCLLREAIAQVSGAAETALALQGLGSYPLVQAGSEEMIARWLPRVIAGDAIAAFALSEPDAGSDAGALALRAEPDGDGWRLHGEKMWISNAPDADVYSVFARTTEGARARGVTAFAIAGDSPGLSGESLDMLAPHPIGRLVFDGVPVGRADVLGEVDGGYGVAMRTLDLFRPSVGAFAVGMAQAALDAAVRWSVEREVYGGPLHAQQAVQHTLAEMATRVRASRLLVRAAATSYDEGADARTITTDAAMAKLFATESAQWVVDQAVQLHGARALQRGHLLEHLYREVRAPRIYEGASEVQRTIIGRALVRAAQEGSR